MARFGSVPRCFLRDKRTQFDPEQHLGHFPVGSGHRGVGGKLEELPAPRIECSLNVLRGGSWLDPSRFLTVTLRNPWSPTSRNQANGFRVARSLDW